jgi:hypothetical protein
VKVSSALCGVVILITVISLLCIWFFPSAQDFMDSNTMWNGIRSFSDEFDAHSIESLDELPSLPERTTLVAIPYLSYSNKELAGLKRFVSDGGTLLLMDDYGQGNGVLAYLNLSVRFTNKPLLDPLFCYRNQNLPKIVDLAPKVNGSGIYAIVLNHATTLTDVEQVETIAWSSTTSFLDKNDNGTRDEDEPKGPFPVAAKARFGKGTVAIVADPSIIINSMVSRYDNYSLIRYLITDKDEEEILIDKSHLAKTSLDITKVRLADAREVLSTPYPMLGFVALLFVVVSKYTLKLGETSG